MIFCSGAPNLPGGRHPLLDIGLAEHLFTPAQTAPVRFACPPEAVVLTLVAGEA